MGLLKQGPVLVAISSQQCLEDTAPFDSSPGTLDLAVVQAE